MTALDALPSSPLGWNASNNALRTFSVSAVDRVSVRICRVAESPLPTRTTDSGAWPSALLKTSSTACGVAVVETPATGIAILVPPSKSIPKLKPRTRMLAIMTSMITPLIAYHMRRLPMTSKAPVPV